MKRSSKILSIFKNMGKGDKQPLPLPELVEKLKALEQQLPVEMHAPHLVGPALDKYQFIQQMSEDDERFKTNVDSAKTMVGTIVKLYEPRVEMLLKNPSLRDTFGQTKRLCEDIAAIKKGLWPEDLQKALGRMATCVKRGDFLSEKFQREFRPLSDHYKTHKEALMAATVATEGDKRGKKRTAATTVATATVVAATVPGGGGGGGGGLLKGDALKSFIADCEARIPRFKSQMEHASTFDQFQKELAVLQSLSENPACALLGGSVESVRLLMDQMTTSPAPCCCVCTGVSNMFQATGYCARHYFDHVINPRLQVNMPSALEFDTSIYEALREKSRELEQNDVLTCSNLSALIGEWTRFDSSILGNPPSRPQIIQVVEEEAEEEDEHETMIDLPQPPPEAADVEEVESPPPPPQQPVAAVVVVEEFIPPPQPPVVEQLAPPQAAAAVEELIPPPQAAAVEEELIPPQAAAVDLEELRIRLKKRERSWESVAVERVVSRYGDAIPDEPRKLLKLISGDAQRVFNELIAECDEGVSNRHRYVIVMVMDGQPFVHSQHASWQEAQDAMPPPCEFITHRIMKC